MTFKAIILDMDGTLADTEGVHLEAFNMAFADEGLDWHWDVASYIELLQIPGGLQRLRHFWGRMESGRIDISGSGVADTIQRIHDRKTAYYQEMVHAGAISLRDGVMELIAQARSEGIVLAVATGTAPGIVATLLRAAIGPDWRFTFQVVEDGTTTLHRKPHPEVYVRALQKLCLPPRDCLVIEDSARGLRAARGAGLATVIVPTAFTAGQDFRGALRVLPGLRAATLEQLQDWHSAALGALVRSGSDVGVEGLDVGDAAGYQVHEGAKLRAHVPLPLIGAEHPPSLWPPAW